MNGSTIKALFLLAVAAVSLQNVLAQTTTPAPTPAPAPTPPPSCTCCEIPRRVRDRSLKSKDQEQEVERDLQLVFDCAEWCDEYDLDDDCPGTDWWPFPFSCFSEKATVQVLQKGVISIKDLQVGDQVLTGKHQDRYETVYAFGHIHPTKAMKFHKIYTADKSAEPLEISGNHLVFVDGKDHPVRADSVKISDSLRADHDQVVRVNKIQRTTRTGVYAPLTPSGTIVVNGVVASAYVSLQDDAVEYAEFSNGVKMPFFTQHFGCHLWMSPVRMLCMGVSGRFCESHDEDGLLRWVKVGQELVSRAMEYNVVIQALMLGVAFVSLIGFRLIEMVFGATWAPSILFSVVVVVLAVKRSGISFVARREKSKHA